MPSYVTPKRATEYIFYISLVSQANTKIFQANPTIAAGDFKVSIDGGALANPATLPAVTPASSKLVKVTLSIAEMTGDNISLICSDASGAEWCDLTINIQTSVRQIDDLLWPTVSGRSLDVTAGGEAGIDWANIGSAGTSVNLSNTNIDIDQVIASVSGAVGSVTGNVGGNVVGSVGSVVGAVGSVTGNVGGNVTGSVGSVAAGGITASSIATGAIDADALAADAIDEIWDEIFEGTLTMRQGFRLFLSALAGKSTGGGTANPNFRDNADSKNRIAATVDASGNRTAITLDAT